MKRHLFKGPILPSKIFTRCFLLLLLEHLIDLILCRLTYAGADVAVKLEEEPSGLPLKVITEYMLCSPISMYCLKPWMPFDNKAGALKRKVGFQFLVLTTTPLKSSLSFLPPLAGVEKVSAFGRVSLSAVTCRFQCQEIGKVSISIGCHRW